MITEPVNLLQETIDCLNYNGKHAEDVVWVGNKKEWFSWKQFVDAANFEYNSHYGKAMINESLVVVGHGWWLEREEYDGQEWWEFKEMPTTFNKINLTGIGAPVFRRNIVNSPTEYYLNAINEFNRVKKI